MCCSYKHFLLVVTFIALIDDRTCNCRILIKDFTTQNNRCINIDVSVVSVRGVSVVLTMCRR